MEKVTNFKSLIIVAVLTALFTISCEDESLIDTQPVAAFSVSVSEAIIGEVVQFIDASFDQNGGEIVSWSWSFGDGTTSDLPSPSHSFLEEGSYNVELSVTDNTGNQNANDFSKTIIVTKPSTATTLPTIKWSFDVPYRTKASSPAIDDNGTIYFGCDGKEGGANLYAVNPDGSEKWQYETGDIIRSAPAIGSDGTIYVGSYDDNLHAFTPDGTPLFQFDLEGNAKYAGAVTGENGVIYIGSQSDNLFAINTDGSERWRFSTGGDVNGTPAIGSDGSVYVGSTDGKFYAVNSDGTEKWSADYGSWTATATAISDDGTVYFAGEGNSNDAESNGVLIAFDPDNGNEKWRVSLENKVNQGGPAIAPDGTIYVGGFDKEMVAYNPGDGSVKWSYPTNGAIMGTPAIDNEGNIYFGDDYGWFYVVDPEGNKKWKEMEIGGGVSEAVWSSPAIGNDGTIYITASQSDESARLYAIKTDATGLATGGWPMVSKNPKHQAK